MTEKQNGAVVRDITTTLTETVQMYVVMPVPASVQAAIKPTNQPANWTLASNAPAAPATQTAEIDGGQQVVQKDLPSTWEEGFRAAR
jgi:hypothetical protein